MIDVREVVVLAARWAAEQETWLMRHGEKLTPTGKKFAAAAGVKNCDKIKISFQSQIPAPRDPFLKSVNEQLQLITPNTEGLTLGYGIFVRSDKQKENKLLVHEFAHVAQVERLGGLTSFLSVYLQQCFDFGYFNAPLEVEARAIADRLIPAV